PNPAGLLQADFRRALVHALDRQAMMDSLVGGATAIAHGVIVNPSRQEEYRASEASIVRYDYDPRRAAQLLEGLGYRKGPDGLYLDPAGQKFSLEIRTTTGDVQQERTTLATQGNWQ